MRVKAKGELSFYDTEKHPKWFLTKLDQISSFPTQNNITSNNIALRTHLSWEIRALTEESLLLGICGVSSFLDPGKEG